MAKIKKEKEEVEERARQQAQYIADLEKRVADSERKRAALHNKVPPLCSRVAVGLVRLVVSLRSRSRCST